MVERRSSTRQKSFLQGRVHFSNRRQSVDCLVRDVSAHGARLVFADTVTVPDLIEVYLSNKDTIVPAHVQWRRGKEVGIVFGLADLLGLDPAGGAGSTDVFVRLAKLENDHASLKRMVVSLQAELRKLQLSETV